MLDFVLRLQILSASHHTNFLLLFTIEVQKIRFSMIILILISFEPSRSPLIYFASKVSYLTYLCGITTNIWLRPVEEDLSMSACFEHSASNL
jgi:hypothetical protein